MFVWVSTFELHACPISHINTFHPNPPQMIKALQVLRIHLLELEKVSSSARLRETRRTRREFHHMQCHFTRTRQRRPSNCLIYDIGLQVQELCRDFCTRYIACLRGKMQSENLLRSDYPLEHNNNMSNSNSPVNNNSPEQVGHTHTLHPRREDVRIGFY